MSLIPFTTVGMTTAVLKLGKSAWKLGSSLTKLDEETRIVDSTIKNLAGEVTSFGIVCDLLFAELEKISNSEVGSPLPYDVDGRMWACLGTQVDESGRTMEELDYYVKMVRAEDTEFMSQSQRQRKLDHSKDQIANVRKEFGRHTDNLRTTLLLINTVLAHIAPGRADQDLYKQMDELQLMIEKLQNSLETNSQWRSSHTEATLIQCAREVIAKGTAMYEANLAAESAARGLGPQSSNTRVTEWVNTLESIRRDQRLSDPSEIMSNSPSMFSGDEAPTVFTSATSAQRAKQAREAVDPPGDESDDDLDTDLAKAALDTGTTAFEAQDWEEADSFLQEALRILQQLSKQQRAFCDIFALQYKLAVCAYHNQEPVDAEGALTSLIQQPARSDEQRRYIYEAAHLLSYLYVRMGQIDRARSECEKALQARRRLLGKRSDASIESTALLAHIYSLLNNRTRAKSYLAMIPEERRDAVVRLVEESLSTKVEQLNSPSLLSRSTSEDTDLDLKSIKSRNPAPSLAHSTIERSFGSASSNIPPLPTTNLRQPHQRIPSNASNKVEPKHLQSITVTSLWSAETRHESEAVDKDRANEEHSAISEVTSPSPGESHKADENVQNKALSRKEILDKVGCQPRDRIEEAVCDGDPLALVSLLNKKKDSWKSKFRKHVRPERVTALHFAALFGEVDMARRLIASGFNVNEIPFGYSTSLTPLKFAVGARQVDMVKFLIQNEAKPSDPETWSTLAGQLMNRSWLMKTMSECEKEYVPDRIIGILKILYQYGWDVNKPFEASGGTVLHQAVAFWTGSYRWDLTLRAAVAAFLCGIGADPLQANNEGKSPYDMALASGDQELLLVLNRGTGKTELGDTPVGRVELSSMLSVRGKPHNKGHFDRMPP